MQAMQPIPEIDTHDERLITVSEYIADYLVSQGVCNAFMLSGTGSIYLDDAFLKHDAIRCVNARHEASAALMAMADAKLNNRPGLVIATTGPGGLNAFSGVAEAWVDSTPIIVITGQVETKDIGARARSFGVQGFDIVSCARNITKYAAVVSDPDEIDYHLKMAFAQSMAGRPGPVWLDIPMDIQRTLIPKLVANTVVPAEIGRTKSVAPLSQTLQEKCDALVAALALARRPLIIAGQGIRQGDAVELLRDFVNRSGIPTVQSRMGQDLLGVDENLIFGLVGIRGKMPNLQILKEADLLIALGCSLPQSITGENDSALNPEASLVMINIDADDIAKLEGRVALAIEADVGVVLSQMLRRTDIDTDKRFSAWVGRCQQLTRSARLVTDEDRSDPINTYHLMERLDFHSLPGSVFISDAGGSYYAVGQALSFSQDKREITSSAFASMGTCLPMAIGAAVSGAGRPVIAIVGDGSIETNIQELITIAENQLNIKIFVINNGGYASIRDSQDELCDGRYTDAFNVLNFEKAADLFGLAFCRIGSCDEIESDIPRVLSAEGAWLIEVLCDRDQEMKMPLQPARDS